MSAPAAVTRLDDYPLSRRALLWLLAAQGLVVLPFLLHGPAWVAPMSLGLLGLRAVSLQYDLRLPSRWLLFTMLAVTVVAVVAQFGTLFGRDAGTALLLLLLGLKQFETRALRDAMIGVFLGYLALAALFLFSQSIPTALYALGTGVLLAATLSALNPGSSEAPIGTSLRLALRLIVQSLPIVAILFLLFPRIQGPLWKTPVDEVSGQTGLSGEMSPGEISRLISSKRPAFRVTFEGPIPQEPDRYWRGPVLWDFDGRTWRMSRALVQETAEVPRQHLQRPVDYTVTMEPHRRRWVFPLDLPGRAPMNMRLTGDFQLRVHEPIREVRQYTLRSYLGRSFGTELTGLERQRALALPTRFAQRAQALGRSWRTELESEAAVVRRALEYFGQEPFFYTVEPPALRIDPVDEFLFESRQGFCEHYAGSFVVLMRAAGIPARVVTGYQGGEYNPLGDYLLVRQADAHAWAEVWLRGRGWLRIDPTAAVSPDRVDLGIEAALSELDRFPLALRSAVLSDWLRGARLAWDSVNYHWNEWVLAYGPEKQRRLMERLGWHGSNALALVATLTLATLLAMIGYLAVRLWRARAVREEPAVRLYGRFCYRLARIGLGRRPSEGPLDYARRVTRERPDLAHEVEPIVQLYTRMRYAGSGPGGLPRLKALIAAFRPRPPRKGKPAVAG